MTSYELEQQLKEIKLKEQNEAVLKQFEKEKLLIGRSFSSMKFNKKTFFRNECFTAYLKKVEDVYLKEEYKTLQIIYKIQSIYWKCEKNKDFNLNLRDDFPQTSISLEKHEISTSLFDKLKELSFNKSDEIFEKFSEFLTKDNERTNGDANKEDQSVRFFNLLKVPYIELTKDEYSTFSWYGHPFVFNSKLFVTKESLDIVDLMIEDVSKKSTYNIKDIEWNNKRKEELRNIKNRMLKW